MFPALLHHDIGFYSCCLCTHTEAFWRGSLLGLLDRSGGFGGLITPKDIFLPVELGESAGDVNKTHNHQ